MAQKRINGITIAINADTNGVTSGLKELTTQSVSLAKQLKSVDAALKMDPTDTEMITLKQKLLAESVDTTRKRLEALKGAQEDVKRAVESGSIGTDEFIAFQKELIETEKRMKDLEGTTDDTGEEMKETEKEASHFGESLKSGLAAGAKVAAAAVAAVGAASAKLVKDVIEQTGELEQNLGGSESVFGEYAERMQKAGEEAYKNLGISQSEYLATANKMGALLQGTGLDAEKSAEITEKAMQRAADMASVMGIDMSSAMESVAGAAKGNFTMMDNLGVAINDTTLKAYAAEHGLGDLATTQDKVTAAMQMFLDTTEQYDGNFAKEATETISGSFGLLKASWQSMIAGLGNSEADIKNLAENVADSLDAVIENVEPVIENIVEALPVVIDSVIESVEELLPEILPVVEQIFEKVLDSIVRMLPSLIPVAVSSVVTFASALVMNIPKIVQSALQLITALARGIADALPQLIPVAIDAVLQIATTLTDPKTLMPLIRAAFDIIDALIDGLLSPESINAMIEALPEIVENIVDILIDSIDLLLDAAVKIIEALMDYFFEPENLAKIVKATFEILVKLVEGIIAAVWKLGEAAAQIIDTLCDKIGEGFEKIVQAGRDIIDNLMAGVKEKWDEWSSWWEGIGEKIAGFFGGDPDGNGVNDDEVWTSEPAMAVGGIVTRPTRALIGENGVEAVLPLERNTGWIDILADRLAAEGGGTGGGTYYITVNAPTGNAPDIVRALDVAFRNQQIAQARSVGGTAWK